MFFLVRTKGEPGTRVARLSEASKLTIHLGFFSHTYHPGRCRDACRTGYCPISLDRGRRLGKASHGAGRSRNRVPEEVRLLPPQEGHRIREQSPSVAFLPHSFISSTYHILINTLFFCSPLSPSHRSPNRYVRTFDTNRAELEGAYAHNALFSYSVHEHVSIPRNSVAAAFTKPGAAVYRFAPRKGSRNLRELLSLLFFGVPLYVLIITPHLFIFRELPNAIFRVSRLCLLGYARCAAR